MSRQCVLKIMIALVIAGCCRSAIAQNIHEGDVILKIQNDQVHITKALPDGIAPQWHVWSQNLGGIFPNFANDPGFDSATGTFVPGTTVGISVRKALRVWNVDDAHFDDIAEPEQMTIEHAGNLILTPESDPASPAEMPEIALGNAGSTGKIHTHPWYGLTEPHSDGLYLLELEAWVSTSGIAPSEPFWIVFNQNMPSDLVDVAVAWVEENLIDDGETCPADLTGDGSVGVADLLVMIGSWGACPDGAPCPADLTGDGTVGVADLLVLIGSWGACP